MQISRALRRMLSFVANIPRAVLGTRVNPNARRIRAGTGKFDLNTDTCGNGNFFFADFKNIWIQEYYVLFQFRSSVVRDNVKDTRSRVFANYSGTS